MITNRVGQQLGNYRLTGLLGRGGFAEVYLGEHVYLKTQAAIKVLQARLAGAEEMAGFLREAQTVAHLSHPNIVRILDFGVDGETPFLVMDYAPNGTLRQHHPRGKRLPLETVTKYVRQVADALQYAHDEKLIHRDIKPENMLVGKRQDILLSDFGIALIAQSSRYQSTQDVIGTVAYMSPEQIQGKPRPASDQYSLGIVVYEWLSGDRPFSGSFTELCTQHMFAPVSPLHEKVPTITPEVEQVVMTALAKDPKQRFGSIQAFATALEQASQTKPASISSTSLPSSSDPTIAPAIPPTQLAGQSRPLTSPVFPSTEAAAPFSGTVPGNQMQKPHEERAHPSSPASPWTTRGVARVERAADAQPLRLGPKPVTTAPESNRKTWFIGVAILASVALIIAALVNLPGILHPSSPFTMVHGNEYFTNCYVGTGYDTKSGTIEGGSSSIAGAGEAPLFKTTVYLACQLAYSINPAYVSDYLEGRAVNLWSKNGVGTIDGIHNIYYNHYDAPFSGNYTWYVNYNGAKEASGSFQVT